MHKKRIKINKKNNNLQHDSLFKQIMSNKLAAREFLDEHLPTHVKSILDLNSIQVEKESFIEPNLTKRFSDIIYRVRTKNQDANSDNKVNDSFIYILSEEQSSVDQTMPLRLWRYILLLAERHIKDKDKIPLIFPIVIYSGQAKYTAPRTLWELFHYPDIAKEMMINEHALLDLQNMSDDDITRKKHIALFEFVMKHIHTRDILNLWDDLLKRMPDAVLIDKENEYFYIKSLLWYTDARLASNQIDDLSSIMLKHLPKNDGDKIMKTIADTYIDEGKMQGIQEGKMQGIQEVKMQGIQEGKMQGIQEGKMQGLQEGAIIIAQNMLAQKCSVEFISSVTGLKTDQIIEIEKETR